MGTITFFPKISVPHSRCSLRAKKACMLESQNNVLYHFCVISEWRKLTGSLSSQKCQFHLQGPARGKKGDKESEACILLDFKHFCMANDHNFLFKCIMSKLGSKLESFDSRNVNSAT